MKKFTNHCLDRLTFGARLQDVSAFNALGGSDDERLSAWVDQQLDWSSIDDSAFDARIAPLGFDTLNKTLQEQWYDHHVLGDDRARPASQMEKLVVTRALHSKRQLLESLADFWHNHFNVYLYDLYAMSTFVSWDRDVIRPPISGFPRRAGMQAGHMLGNFRKMLELTSQHAAMQYYLDNFINEEGNPNENYAREVMELHTLGAENYTPLGNPASIPKSSLPMPWGNNGADVMVQVADHYVDDDVYSAMRMLTGWKMKNRSDRDHSNYEDTGEPFFYEPWHDPFLKTILGHQWSDFSSAPNDILQFFDLLAYHPGTARHIAGKLCRRFISPNPPQAAIDDVAATFYEQRYANDQLEQTYRTLFNHSAFKDPANWGTILKRPMEAIVSAMRVCGSNENLYPDSNNAWPIINFYMGRSGNRPFYRRSPDGYPVAQEEWLGSNTLLYVMRAFDWLCDKDRDDQDKAVMPLLRVAENASESALPNHSPNNLASFWLRRILGFTPDGGWEGQPLHDALSAYLRQHPNDFSQWPGDLPFENGDGESLLGSDWPNYFHERMRGAVKLALSTPQFLYR